MMEKEAKNSEMYLSLVRSLCSGEANDNTGMSSDIVVMGGN